MGLSVQKAGAVGCPVLEQSPVNIECRVREVVSLGTHDMFIADIVRLDVAKELIDSNGRLELDKARLLAYAHGEYFALGRKLGSFGYSVRRKKRKSNNKGKGKRKI